MVRFATVAGAGDLGFPVCGPVVNSAGCFSAFGDGGPGFGGSRDISHKTACGDMDEAALRTLSLCHAETTRLFRRGA